MKEYVSSIVFVSILLVSTTLSSFNIGKLNLQTLDIYNTTNTQQKIKISFFSDHSAFTEHLLLPQEKKIIFNNHCIIEKVVTTSSFAYPVAKISDDNESICVHIQAEKESSSSFPRYTCHSKHSGQASFSGLLPFDDVLKTDPGLEKILLKSSPADCRRLPNGVTPTIFIKFIRMLYEKIASTSSNQTLLLVFHSSCIAFGLVVPCRKSISNGKKSGRRNTQNGR